MMSREKSSRPAKLELLGHMAVGVTHDFNNLLTFILGNTQIGKMEIDPDDKLYKILDDISSAAENAAELTHQILAFSNDEHAEPKDIDLNDQLTGMSRMLSSMVGERVNLTIVCEEQLGLIEATAGHIQQVLVNLVLNARDAMPNGGELKIETSNVAPDSDWNQHHPNVPPGDYVMIIISDNGLGLSDTTKKVMFDEFFTTKPTGRGIGLSNVKRIVDQYSGVITVSSAIGEGTVFRIYFPSLPEKMYEVSQSDFRHGLPHGDENILIVEDRSMIREVTKTILENLGYTVACATDGAEALRYSTSRFDLVIIDIDLPDMDGQELVKQLSKRRTGSKVLYMSGYSTAQFAGSHLDIGGDGFLEKPFTHRTLATKVRQVLDETFSGYR